MSFEFKILLTGEEGVGKTSLIIRFLQNRFDDSENKSIGGDFVTANLDLFGAPIKLQLQDFIETNWEQVASFYVQDVDGILVVLDTTSKAKMKPYLDYWLKTIRNINQNIPILVIGNKNDLATKINFKKTAQYVQTLGSNFIETSAKTGENVSYAFKLLASEIVKRKAAAKKQSSTRREDGLDPIFSRYNF